MKKYKGFLFLVVILSIAALACGVATIPNVQINPQPTTEFQAPLPTSAAQSNEPQGTVPPAITLATNTPAAAATGLPNTGGSGAPALLGAYEGTLETIYSQVNPSVVNIHVVLPASAGGSSQQDPFGNPGGQGQGGGVQEALGSGFIYDTQGHIVTNNHVAGEATQIDVTFSDGTTVQAKLVGADPYSDLAVVQVNAPAELIHPVTMGDSKQVKVGQLAIAIGNPFGLSGSMTAGIISALNRSIPATNQGNGITPGQSYTIPDVIQTDAPINPGNSGGVLVDAQGQVIGVTAAIESASNSNSGIGFVIPSSIVQKVVPALIKSGHYDHPWLGISGTDMTPDLAKAMNLNPSQRGAMIEDVTAGGPAEKGGLHGSNNQADINGQTVPVGGDVVIGVDKASVKSMTDLIAYLEDNTQVGQTITLNVLRNGQPKDIQVTLGARPASSSTASSNNGGSGQGNGNGNGNGQGNGGTTAGAFLGITGADLNPQIDQAMNLPSNIQGVLVEQVSPGSPAASGGLKGGDKTINSGGQQIMVGGDVIIGIDNQQITSLNDLRGFLAQAQAGQQVTLNILRNGQHQDVPVTLGSAGG